MPEKIAHNFGELNRRLRHLMCSHLINKEMHPGVRRTLGESADVMQALAELRADVLGSNPDDGVASDKLAASVITLLGINPGS